MEAFDFSGDLEVFESTEQSEHFVKLNVDFTRMVQSKLQCVNGEDSKDRVFEDICTMWSSMLSSRRWYTKSSAYWADPSNCGTDENGMLGGFAVLDPADVKANFNFIGELAECVPVLKPVSALALQKYRSCGKEQVKIASGSTDDCVPRCGRALDCGAGIGRVTKHMLGELFETVDMVEGDRRLLEASPAYMGDVLFEKMVGKLYCNALQDFIPKPNEYECIWVQWVIIYLTDFDFVRFMRRCLKGLKEGGVLVIKENVLASNSQSAFLVDCDDTSLTRSLEYMDRLFEVAGCRILRKEAQADFPKDMFPVYTWALVPAVNSSGEGV